MRAYAESPARTNHSPSPQEDDHASAAPVRRVHRHVGPPSNAPSAPSAKPEEQQAHAEQWKAIVAGIRRGDVPDPHALPPCPKADPHPDGNVTACRRLREIKDDPTLDDALRVEFLAMLADRLGESDAPPASGLFAVMQNLYWQNYRKFARQSARAPKEAAIEQHLGRLLRAESYQALMVNKKLRPTYFTNGDWYAKYCDDHPEMPTDPMSPAVELKFPQWAEIALLAPAITPADLNPEAFLGSGASNSMWVTGERQLDGKAPIGEQLALERDVAKRALIFHIEPHEAATAEDKLNPERAGEGSSARRPTALDFMTSDTGGEINRDEATADFGRTETKRDDNGNQVGGGKLELLVPPVPIGSRSFEQWPK